MYIVPVLCIVWCLLAFLTQSKCVFNYHISNIYLNILINWSCRTKFRIVQVVLKLSYAMRMQFYEKFHLKYLESDILLKYVEFSSTVFILLEARRLIEARPHF